MALLLAGKRVSKRRAHCPGIDPELQIDVLRVYDEAGSFSRPLFFRALRQSRTSVVVAPFAGLGMLDKEFSDLLDDFLLSNRVLIVPAGNAGPSLGSLQFPGWVLHPSLLTIGATKLFGSSGPFFSLPMSFNFPVICARPGLRRYLSVRGFCAEHKGTSIAAVEVAGFIASLFPQFTDITSFYHSLIAASRPFGYPFARVGFGVLQPHDLEFVDHSPLPFFSLPHFNMTELIPGFTVVPRQRFAVQLMVLISNSSQDYFIFSSSCSELTVFSHYSSSWNLTLYFELSSSIAVSTLACQLSCSSFEFYFEVQVRQPSNRMLFWDVSSYCSYPFCNISVNDRPAVGIHPYQDLNPLLLALQQHVSVVVHDNVPERFVNMSFSVGESHRSTACLCDISFYNSSAGAPTVSSFYGDLVELNPLRCCESPLFTNLSCLMESNVARMGKSCVDEAVNSILNHFGISNVRNQDFE